MLAAALDDGKVRRINDVDSTYALAARAIAAHSSIETLVAALSSILVILVSYLTPSPSPGAIKYTWHGATPAEKAATRASWSGLDVALSVIALIATVAFYYAFW
jgi:hypothetical protein